MNASLAARYLLAFSAFTPNARAADFYWVGGTGNWSDFATHWATASAGSTFHTQAPTSADNVFFDAASFPQAGQAVTLNQASSFCRDMNWTGVANNPGFTGTSSFGLKISGSLTLATAMSVTATGTFTFEGAGIGKTVSFAGKTMSNTIQFNDAGADWTLIDGFTTTGNLNHLAGTVTANNISFGAASFQSTGTLARTFNLGSSTFTGSGSSLWFISGSGATINAGTSTLIGSSSTSLVSFQGGGFAYHNLSFPSAAAAAGGTINGDNSFNDVSFASQGFIAGSNTFQTLTLAPGGTYTLTAGKTQTIAGALSAYGNCSGLITLKSNSAGIATTLNKASGYVTVSNVALQDIAAAGGATFIANNAIDMGNVTGWTLNPLAPQDLYWVGNSGNFNDGAHWAAASGGTATGCTPTTVDNVHFDAQSFTTATRVVTMTANAYCRNMDWTGAGNNPGFTGSSSFGLFVSGSLTFVTGMNWSSAGVVTFNAGAPGKTITTAGKNFTGNLTFNGPGGGWTLQDNVSTGGSFFLTAGSLNTNGKNLNMQNFTSGGNAARALDLGASTLILSNSQWNISGTGLTLNAGTSWIRMGSTSGPVFSGNGLTYYDLQFGSTGPSLTGTINGANIFNHVHFASHGVITGNNVIQNLTLAAGRNLTLTAGTTQTLNGSVTASGTCAGLVGIQSGTAGSPATLSKSTGSITIDGASIQDITASGGAAFTANASLDMGGNSGWTVDPRASQDLYWIGNSGSWTNGAKWSTTSGGAASGCVPTAADNVRFDANSFTTAAQTLNMDASPGYCKSMDWSGAANTPTFSGFTPLKLYGSLTLVPEMTFSFSGQLYFEGAGAGKTITTARKPLTASMYFSGAGGSWTLQDSLKGSSYINLNAGTLNTNNHPMMLNGFTSMGNLTRTLNLGASEIKFANNYATWTVTGAGLTVIPGTSAISFARTGSFTGGGKAYHNLSMLNASLDTAQTLSGDNTFNDLLINSLANITGSNTFRNLTLNPGRAYRLTGGTTQSIAPGGKIFASGTAGSPITIQSITPGTAATLSKASGEVCLDYARIQDISATGGATFNAGLAPGNSQNLGGNSGWLFTGGCTPPSLDDKTWDGGGNDNLWHTAANWSGDAAPAAGSNVIFDATSAKNCALGAVAGINSITMGAGYTGVFDFGAQVLTVSGNADFRSGGSIEKGSGALVFAGSGAQSFHPKAGTPFPHLGKTGTGTTTFLGNVQTGNLGIQAGSLNLGSGRTHAVLFVSGAGSLAFNGSTLQASGDVDFSNLAALEDQGGTLEFTAATGQQAFTAKAGATHPHVVHSGAGMLRLGDGNLSCLSFKQQAGTLDFNGGNVSVIGTGAFQVLNGGPTTMANLSGRTITVGGNASFTGQKANRLNLNPASAWTLNVAGSLNALHADIALSLASGTRGQADSSQDMGGNSNWKFPDTTRPANVTAFTATALGPHTAALAWTGSISGDADSIMVRYRADGTYPSTQTDGSLLRISPRSRAVDTATGLAEKTLYHFAMFVKDSAGNWSAPAAGAQDTAAIPSAAPPPRLAFIVGQALPSPKEDSVTRWYPAFADPDPAATHTFSLLAAPSWAAREDSSLVFRPQSRDVGPAQVRFIVANAVSADTLTASVTVANVNDAPVAFPAGTWHSQVAWEEDRVDTFTIVVVDMDRGDPVTLASGLPPYLTCKTSVDTAQGFNRFFHCAARPRGADTGPVSLKLDFTDAAGATGSLSLTGRIKPVNDMPKAVITRQVALGGAARFDFQVEDEDGSLAGTRFYYILLGEFGDIVRHGITDVPLLVFHPLADGAYRLLLAAEDEHGLAQAEPTTADLVITGSSAVVLDSGVWHLAAIPAPGMAAAALGAGAEVVAWNESGDERSAPGRYASGTPADTLRRGQGYWIRVAKRVVLSVPATRLTAGPFAIRLSRSRQGWNQIGNPFPYHVDLSGTGLRFWQWDPVHRDLSDAGGIMKPWHAYWVQATRDTVITIPDAPWFPSQAKPLAKAAGFGARSRGDWALQLSLRAGEYRDQANFLGIRRVTSAVAEGAGPAKPPKIGEHIAFRFETPAAAGETGEGAHGFRMGMGEGGEWWDFAVENRGTDQHAAELAIPGLEELSALGLHAFLVHKGQARILSPGETPMLPLDGETNRYSLVVTPDADFAKRLLGGFAVSQNFPNPVSAATTFRFFLPDAWGADGKRSGMARRVRLEVYDGQGRLAARVADRAFGPGTHSLVWKPLAKGGSPLAKGAYLYRLESQGQAKTMKLMVK